MATLLNIDTAVDTASVCLAKDGQAVQFDMNAIRNDHAAWLHPAINKTIAAAGLLVTDLDAVAVTIGPGSYTGLRVGLAAAKGLCFALNIPLIVVNTLEMMAYAVKDEEADLLCPMIDARRMEVFMAVFDKELKPVIHPTARILDPSFFDTLPGTNTILFSGNGCRKLDRGHPRARFSEKTATAADMVSLAGQYFQEKKFADLAYSEPFYIKEFYTTAQV